MRDCLNLFSLSFSLFSFCKFFLALLMVLFFWAGAGREWLSCSPCLWTRATHVTETGGSRWGRLNREQARGPCVSSGPPRNKRMVEGSAHEGKKKESEKTGIPDLCEEVGRKSLRLHASSWNVSDRLTGSPGANIWSESPMPCCAQGLHHAQSLAGSGLWETRSWYIWDQIKRDSVLRQTVVRPFQGIQATRLHGHHSLLLRPE